MKKIIKGDEIEFENEKYIVFKLNKDSFLAFPKANEEESKIETENYFAEKEISHISLHSGEFATIPNYSKREWKDLFGFSSEKQIENYLKKVENWILKNSINLKINSKNYELTK